MRMKENVLPALEAHETEEAEEKGGIDNAALMKFENFLATHEPEDAAKIGEEQEQELFGDLDEEEE